MGGAGRERAPRPQNGRVRVRDEGDPPRRTWRGHGEGGWGSGVSDPAIGRGQGRLGTEHSHREGSPQGCFVADGADPSSSGFWRTGGEACRRQGASKFEFC